MIQGVDRQNQTKPKPGMALWFPNETFGSERRQLNETNTLFLSSASPGENLLKATQTLYTCMSIECFLFICRVHIHSVGSRLF